MNRILAFAAALSLPLGGCVTPVGRTIVAKLPDYEIRHAPTITCSDFLVRIDPEAKLTNAQQRAAVKVCEEMTKGAIIKPAEIQEAMRQTIPTPF